MEMLKGVLREELENSYRRIEAFEKALEELPQGSIHEKVINDKKYYYRVYWDSKAKKNVFEMLEEKPSKKFLSAYEKAIEKRASYKNQIRILKLQVQFLGRALRAREFQIAEECARKAA